jgi:hypothetical protein
VSQPTAPPFERVPSEFKAEALQFEENVFGFIAKMWSLESKFKIEFNVMLPMLCLSLASK